MPAIMKLLGYAGLLPFIALAALSIIVKENTSIIATLSLYSFGIFTFLCGAWWPTVDMQQAKFWRILLSNIFFLMAFFSYLLIPENWLAIGAGLFIVMWAIERFSALVPKPNLDYLTMRAILTSVASISMLISYIWSGA